MQRVFDALAQGDTDALNSFLSDQMILKLPDGHPVGGTHKGVAEITEARERGFSVLGVSRVEVIEIFAQGPSMVIVLLTSFGTDPAGKLWSMPGADLFEIVDGKVTTLTPFFYDTARLQQIAGPRREEL